MNYIYLIFLIIFHFKIRLIYSEVFTAKIELEHLTKTHSEITNSAENYLTKEESRLNKIRRKILQVKNLGAKSLQQKNIESPFDSFRVIKTLGTELEELEELSKIANKENEDNFNVLNSRIQFLKSSPFVKFPTIEEDCKGAVIALGRLQSTYNLNVSRMADGYLNEHCCAEKLDFSDCYDIGAEHFFQKNYIQSIKWMKVAHKKFSEFPDEIKKELKDWEIQILKYIYEAYFHIGDLLKSGKYVYKVLEIEPNLEAMRFIKNLEENFSKVLNKSFNELKFESLCRGDQISFFRKKRRLKCKYTHNNLPHLLIGPYKEEMMHENPKISIFYEIISQSEIDAMIEIAEPKLYRTIVYAGDQRKTIPSNIRISKGGWITDRDLDVARKLSRRIKYFTGLDTNSSEPYNTVNYGIGGHYGVHRDYTIYGVKSMFDERGIGNRIATVLIYLTDVEAGGATVFPILDVIIKPVKGSAAFWYNLFDDGYTDERTLHGGCPVLIGTKWIANKWIHETGNEFRRPCTRMNFISENENANSQNNI